MHRYSLNLCRESVLRERASAYFIEVANGIYNVDKDRNGVYGEWVDLRSVTGALITQEAVLVRNLNGNIFSNTDLLRSFENRVNK